MTATAKGITDAEIAAAAAYGVNSALMKPVVEKLSIDDMIALAGYAASLSP
jgi:hypothetical protein